MRLPPYTKACSLILSGLLLASCGNAPASESISILDNPVESVDLQQPVPTEQPVVALVMKTLTNPFFIEMERGARLAEKELGITLLVRTASQETSIEQQINIISDLIRSNVDAIVVAPGDSVELIPVLKQAQDAGITIINIDNRLDVEQSGELTLTEVPFISVDNVEGAYRSAQVLSEQIQAPTTVAILEGIRTAQNAKDRKQGAVRAFQENPQIERIVTETANWKIDEAYEVTRLLMSQNPDISAIFAANDMMALGAIEYLEDAQISGVNVAAYDALDEAIAAIREGTLMATVDQQAAQQGYIGVQYAVKALSGESIPLETMVDLKLISQESTF